MGRRANTDDVFWSRVDKRGPDECWPWTGRTKPPGVGMEVGHGLYDHDGTYDYAHRYAYKLVKGEPKDDVLHTCDYAPCCNPAHLYDGTDLDNARDREARGRRNVQGERHPSARLTPTAVLDILTEPRTYGYRQRLAARHGVRPSTISAIVGGKKWQHLSQ